MARKKRRKTGGRVAGTPNKRSALLAEYVSDFLENRGSNPFEFMADLYEGKAICSTCNGKKKLSFKAPGDRKAKLITCVACHGSGKLIASTAARLRAASELSEYVRAKLKHMEINPRAGAQGATFQELLEQYRMVTEKEKGGEVGKGDGT